MDVITHVTDLAAFRAECMNLINQTDELGNPLVPELSYDAEAETLVYGVTKIPVHYDGNESLTLIRAADDSQLTHFTHMVRLGVFDGGQYVFDSPEAQAEYERVRGDLSYTYTDPDGNVQTGTKPYMLGVFL